MLSRQANRSRGRGNQRPGKDGFESPIFLRSFQMLGLCGRTGLIVIASALFGLGAAPAMAQKSDKGTEQKAISVVERLTKAIPDKAQAMPKRQRKLLVYSRTEGARHASIAITIKALTMMGDQTGAYVVHATENPEIFVPEKLNVFDGVMMVNTTGQFLKPLPNGGDAKDTAARHQLYKDSLVQYVKSGKGLMGIHA